MVFQSFSKKPQKLKGIKIIILFLINIKVDLQSDRTKRIKIVLQLFTQIIFKKLLIN
jgi:hypothetical protein